MSQTEGYSSGSSLSDSSEKLFQKSIVFGSFISCQKEKKKKPTSNVTRVHFFIVSKKTGQHIHGESGKPWYLVKNAYHPRITSTGVLGREAFIFKWTVSLWSMHTNFFFIVKADVQHMFKRSQNRLS